MSILGYVFFKGKKISFSLDDFYVKVMETNNRMFFGEERNVDKFLHGITEDGYPIAFQTGMVAYDHMQFTGVPISFYVVDNANAITRDKFDTFEKIQFCGGSLNYLIPTQAAYDGIAMAENRKRDKEDNFKIELLPLDKVSMKTNINIFGQKATYNRYPCFSHNNGRNAALNIYNTVEIKFEEAQPIELMQKCYVFMLRYISFLLGHKDVHFDNIYISKIIYFDNHQTTRKAEVFPNEKHTGDGKATAHKTIQLNWIDKYIQNFISIYESENEFNLDFLPDNESESNHVSIDLIKQLCTAFEIEYTIDNGEKPHNKIVKELSKKAIKEVKTFKKENPELSEKFYSLIMTSIGNWGLPLAEKIMYLYTANKNIMDSFIKRKGWIQCQIDDISIGKFVKARNNSTHGNKRGIEKEDVNFVYLMKVMVYALMMKRLGFEEKTTINIIDNIF